MSSAKVFSLEFQERKIISPKTLHFKIKSAFHGSFVFLAHLSHSDNVSFCDHILSKDTFYIDLYRKKLKESFCLKVKGLGL